MSSEVKSVLELIAVKNAVTANDFTANDSENRLVKISDYKGKKNVVLVFNRGFF
jgi:peroxiredoxin